MSLRVFHETDALDSGAIIVLVPEEAHYLVRVRRAKKGDAVEVLDGVGGHVHGEVVSVSTTRCEVRLGARVPSPEVAPSTVLLGLPEPRAALDAITFATELGATTIVLVRCARSHNAAPSEARLHKTLRAAQRQCGRPRPPTIEGPVPLAQALERADPRPRWVACTVGRHDPTPVVASAAGATVLVGPEGGLTPEEVEAAVAAGFHPLSLGPWILRTETAVCAALARVLGPNPQRDPQRDPQQGTPG